MQPILDFTDQLRLLAERSAAFDATVAAAPRLDVPVPSCPDWTLLDLAQHLGQVRLRWARIVATGPSDTPPPRPGAEGSPVAPTERDELLPWLADGARQLLAALEEAGPDRGCWTWWPDSQSPQTSGAVSRHQVQEATVHTYDAQLALGAPQPLAAEVAVDGVEEFLSTCVATKSPWPHDPAVVDYHVTEGRSWRLWFSGEGARFERLDADAGNGSADATARSTAGELVLHFYGRTPLDTLEVEGDREVLIHQAEWEPA